MSSVSSWPKAAPPRDPLLRSRRSIALDLKKPAGVGIALDLVEGSDILVEGFRPHVLERLGLGPQPCLERNPRLVYGCTTGWGQDGPLAQKAGHDINYIALTGALHLIGQPGGKPIPPLNLVGDFGGGGPCSSRWVCWAHCCEARQTGRGQVGGCGDGGRHGCDACHVFRFSCGELFPRCDRRELLGGAAPYYDTYRTSDDKYVAIGALEPEFYIASARQARHQQSALRCDRLSKLDAQTIGTWGELATRLLPESARARAISGASCSQTWMRASPRC